MSKLKVTGAMMESLAGETKKVEQKPKPKPTPRTVAERKPPVVETPKQQPVEVRVDTDRLERIAVDSSKHLTQLASQAIADIKATSEIHRKEKHGVRMTVNRDHKGLIESIDVVPIRPTEH